jgi:hypothetical protein
MNGAGDGDGDQRDDDRDPADVDVMFVGGNGAHDFLLSLPDSWTWRRWFDSSRGHHDCPAQGDF